MDPRFDDLLRQRSGFSLGAHPVFTGLSAVEAVANQKC